MADILIRGWSVPKGCGVCPLNTGAFYCAGLKRYVIEEEHVWMGSNYRRLKDCPLHELPEHGDLIDADAFCRNIFNGTGDPFIKAGVMAHVKAAHVIIPASKEETE